MSRVQFLQRQAKLIFAGNSLTFGSNATSSEAAYPFVCSKLLRSGDPIWNFGTVSQTTPQMTTAAATQVYPLYDSMRPCIVLGWEGLNDMFSGGSSAAQAYANLQTYYLGAKARGFLVIAATVIDCQNAGRPGSFDADRATLNTNLRNNYAQFAHALCDFAGVTELSDATNQTYFQSDFIHLRDLGYAAAAAKARTAIESIR